MFNPSLAAAFALALAFAGGARAQDADQQQKHLLRYAYHKGAVSHYQIDTEMSMDMAMGEQKMKTTTAIAVFMKMEVVDVTDGKARIASTAYRVKVALDSPQMGKIHYDSDDEDSRPGLFQDLADLVGETFTLSIDGVGAVSDVEVPDGLERAFEPFGGSAAGLFGSIVATLPDEPVPVGHKWETSMQQDMGRAGSVGVEIENTLAAVDGKQATLEQVMQMGFDGLGGGATAEVEQARGAVTLDLAGGLPISSASDVRMTMDMGGMGSMKMRMQNRMKRVPAPADADKAAEGADK